jgi:hypothetical protein
LQRLEASETPLGAASDSPPLRSGRREVYQQNRLSYSDVFREAMGDSLSPYSYQTCPMKNRLDQGIASELEAKRAEVESLCRRTNVELGAVWLRCISGIPTGSQ